MEYYCQRTVDWLEAHKLKTLAEAREELLAYRQIKKCMVKKNLIAPTTDAQKIAIFVINLIDINF